MLWSVRVAVRLEYREIITLANIFGLRSTHSRICVQGPLSHVLTFVAVTQWYAHVFIGDATTGFLLRCFRRILSPPFPEQHFTVPRTIVNTVIAVHSSLNIPPVAFAQRNMFHRQCPSSPAIVIFCATSPTRRREKNPCVPFPTADHGRCVGCLTLGWTQREIRPARGVRRGGRPTDPFRRVRMLRTLHDRDTLGPEMGSSQRSEGAAPA